MSVTESILNRCSTPRLDQPAPSADTLQLAFQCALKAPDHGRLRPWRYLVVKEGGLEALGQVFEQAVRADEPNPGEEKLKKARNMPLRAPMILIAVAKTDPEHPKIPEVEQIVSAGVGVQNLQLALQDQGYACMWRTGPMAYHPQVKTGLGLSEAEHIIGFLYVGTAATQPKRVPPPEVDDFVENWPKS